MNTHKHARLTPYGRALLVQRIIDGARVEEAAQAAGVSMRTAYAFAMRASRGLHNRSSRPHRCPHAISPQHVKALVERRKTRMPYRHISQELGIAVSTVARRLKRLGLNRLTNLQPRPPIVRYQFEHPGDLLPLNIKKLGRFQRPGHRVTGDRTQASDGASWEFIHVAIDDASRIAFTNRIPMSVPRALARPCSRRCAATAA